MLIFHKSRRNDQTISKTVKKTNLTREVIDPNSEGSSTIKFPETSRVLSSARLHNKKKK